MGAVKERYLYGDSPELRKEFYISQEENKRYRNDAEYIFGFRKELRSIISLMAKIGHELIDLNQGKRELKEKIMYLTYHMENFIKDIDKNNFVSRLIFVDKIADEVRKAYDDAGFENFPFVYDNQERDYINFRSFLQYVGHVTLLKDGLLDQFQHEVASEYVEPLMAEIKKDFMADVDENNIKLNDKYSVAGKALQLFESYREKMSQFVKQHCDGCTLDDCYQAHCQYFNESMVLDKQLSLHEKLANMLCERLQGKIFTSEEIKKYFDHNSDDKFYKVAKLILTKDDHQLSSMKNAYIYGDSQQKVIQIENNGDIRLQKSKIVDILRNKVMAAATTKLSQDAITARLLLECDIKCEDEFIEKLDASVRNMYDWVNQYTDENMFGSSLNTYIKEYDKFKHDILNENQKGE